MVESTRDSYGGIECATFRNIDFNDRNTVRATIGNVGKAIVTINYNPFRVDPYGYSIYYYFIFEVNHHHITGNSTLIGHKAIHF